MVCPSAVTHPTGPSATPLPALRIPHVARAESGMNGAARKGCQKSPRTAFSLPLSLPAETGAYKSEEGKLRIFIDVMRKAPGHVATIVFVAISIAVALTAAAVVASLVGRVERLESDLGTAQAKIVELSASLSRLSTNVDTADRSIKSLRSDLDHPRVRPLASTLDATVRPPQ
jgi:hypothetical protein